MSAAEIAYHDTRWCKPVHDERELFAMLCLEGMQAGLSWAIVLKKEPAIRAAFDGFDLEAVAAYDGRKIEALMRNEAIIRNRRKIEATIGNAREFLEVERQEGSFDRYIWGFTDGAVVMHHPRQVEDVPAESELSRTVSRDLKRRGFRFVGSVIIYSYLQAIGVVNDHLDGCIFK